MRVVVRFILLVPDASPTNIPRERRSALPLWVVTSFPPRSPAFG